MIDGDIRLARYAVSTEGLAMVRIMYVSARLASERGKKNISGPCAQSYIKQDIARRTQARFVDAREIYSISDIVTRKSPMERRHY